MANLLADASTWLADQLQSHAATSVIVRRGGQSSAAINATRVDATYDVLDDDGYRHEAKFQDWVFTATDLVIAAVQIQPRPGDVLLVGSESYAVTSPVDRPAVEDYDVNRLMLRVHTVKVN